MRWMWHYVPTKCDFGHQRPKVSIEDWGWGHACENRGVVETNARGTGHTQGTHIDQTSNRGLCALDLSLEVIKFHALWEIIRLIISKLVCPSKQIHDSDVNMATKCWQIFPVYGTKSDVKVSKNERGCQVPRRAKYHSGLSLRVTSNREMKPDGSWSISTISHELHWIKRTNRSVGVNSKDVCNWIHIAMSWGGEDIVMPCNTLVRGFTLWWHFITHYVSWYRWQRSWCCKGRRSSQQNTKHQTHGW